MNAIQELSLSFSRLPGIGPKSATKIVNSLLKQDDSFLAKFSTQIALLKQKVHFCKICGAWTSGDVCPVCQDLTRDKSTICVVETPLDIETIENLGEYKGLYHVLGGVIAPLEGITPDVLAIAPLVKRANQEQVQEIIVATNPTQAGNLTALYLQQALKTTKVKVTRLALGLPMGADISYADKVTMSMSFKGRAEF